MQSRCFPLLFAIISSDSSCYFLPYDYTHDIEIIDVEAQPWRPTLRRLYLGMEKRNGEVIMDATNKWSNLEYFKLTGLREYAPYMMGGGCAENHQALTVAKATR